MTDSQKIRASQFITTYGPGSIIELPDGPALIPSADIGLFDSRSGFSPNDYRIDDDRMSKGLLEGASIYRLPTNSENALPQNDIVYKTKSFPMWHLCQNQSIHAYQGHGNIDILYEQKTSVTHCPICGIPSSHGGNPSNAVRFVRMCKNGHLDEVDWDYVVHQGVQCTRRFRAPDVLKWSSAGGTSLRHIVLECPQCGVSNNFGAYYANPNLKCTGREPQTEHLISSPGRNPTCSADVKIIPRQASNIRMPEIKTLLSIQSVMTKLHRIVQRPEIKSVIRTVKSLLGPVDDDVKLAKLLQIMKDNPEISDSTVLEFEKPNASFEEVREAIESIDRPVPDTYHELILDEFKELNISSQRGAPPSALQKTRMSKPIFEVNIDDVLDITTKKGTKFKITPVSTLQTIAVQTGFKRDDVADELLQSNAELVSVKHFDNATNTAWYPGAAYMGEGIFIRLDSDDVLSELLNSNPVAEEWLRAQNTETNANPGDEKYSKFLFRDSDDDSKPELHPGFVWWHTLSHLLIRIISEESGYSSSAIRERIYFKTNGNKIDGGILLYAAQPGSEGTLGGLTALVPYFKSFLDIALEKVNWCSGDPLCGQNEFHIGKANGASCDICLMNSETSCEHRNMWLDRTILINSMP
ncbi:MAG: DUF1998 domain-containing protein [Candidatus Nitrosopelagicus sp.]|nr:DUF1998 domain-containing protein [Candidatus Nitrosopelagicus sp.]